MSKKNGWNEGTYIRVTVINALVTICRLGFHNVDDVRARRGAGGVLLNDDRVNHLVREKESARLANLYSWQNARGNKYPFSEVVWRISSSGFGRNESILCR